MQIRPLRGVQRYSMAVELIDRDTEVEERHRRRGMIISGSAT